MKKHLILLTALALSPLAHADLDLDHSVADAQLAEIAALLPKTPTVRPAAKFLAPGDPSGGIEAATKGAWGPLIDWTPHVPVTGALLPDGRLLTFASNQRNSFPSGPEFTYAAVWNPATGAFTEINNNRHDMFCGGVASLPDGRILINGGRTCNRWSSVFDWRSNQWLPIQDMNDGRWYNTSLPLPDGQVFTASGTNGERTLERWNAATGWTRYTGIDWQSVLDEPGFSQRWHPFLMLAPDGRILHAGPTDTMHWLTTDGAGTMSNTGTSVPGTHFPKEGAWVVYDEGRVLISGGHASTAGGPSNAAYTVDFRGSTPIVASTGSMANARTFANAVVLPTGEVMVVGGNTSTTAFSDNGSIFATEIWNPTTGQWRTTADIAIGRNYHSMAFLLPDGRVWSGGGGLAGNAAVDHPNAQVFFPPSLFNADGTFATRPSITAVPERIGPGSVFTVNATPGLTRFTLIRMNALTHSVSPELRFIELPSTQVSPGVYNLTARTNLNVMNPGYWMLFGLNANGTYSEARIIQVVSDANSTVTNPGPQSSDRGTPVLLPIYAATNGGPALGYSASNLPAGLSINPTTGVIFGTPTTNGSFNTTVTVTQSGKPPVTVNFTWTIREPLTLTLVAAPPQRAGIAFNVDATAANGTGLSYSWNFSDGFVPTAFSSTSALSRTINPPGRYLVTVTVRDNLGRMKSASYYQSIYSTLTATKPTASSAIAYETRTAANNRVWVVNPDNNTVSIFDAVTNAKLGESAVGDEPRSIAIAPDGRVWVACTSGDKISILSQTTLAEVSSVALPRGSRPYGLAFAPNGSNAWVALEGTGNLLKLNPTTGAQVAAVNVGENARHVSITADSVRVLVSRFITPRLPGESTAVPITTATTGAGMPIGYWPLNGSGADVAGNAGLTDEGAVFTGAFPAKISIGSSIRLTGSQPPSALLNVSETAFTASFWFRTSGANGGLFSVSSGQLGAGGHDRHVYLNGGNIFSRVWSNEVIGSTGKNYADSKWHHAALVFGGAVGGQRIYVDGVQVAAGTKSSSDFTTQDRIYIGFSNDASAAFNGEMDDVAVWSEALDAANITKLASGITPLNLRARSGGEVVVVTAATATVAETAVLEHSERPNTASSAKGIPNYLGAAVISPDGTNAWVPSKQDNIKTGTLRSGAGLAHDSALRATASRINLSNFGETHLNRIDFDNGGMPSAAAYDPFGVYLFVALEASREVAVCDAWGRRVIQRFNVGMAPEGLVVSPDGTRLFVHNFMSRTVTVHDISGITAGGEQPVGTLATLNTVASERLTAQVLQGKRLFYDAADPRLALESYISCASCHNDGGQDGRVWDFTGFGEGLRNTITLRGHGGTAHGPLHWTANFDEVQDFEGQIRNFAGGTGLMTNADFAATSATLGAPKAGRSADLDALAAYVASLNTTGKSPHRNPDGTLTTDAVAGQDVFIAKNCAQCHSGTQFTDSAPGSLRNIGTIAAGSGNRLGGPLTGFDSPTLRGAWATAPYLHNGSAATLGDAILAHSGVTLTGSELTQLTAFLRQIDDAPATAPAPTGTGPVTIVAEDFNDNSRDTAKWSVGAIFAQISNAAAFDPAVGVFERNQRLEIVPRSNVSGDHYAGYVSASTLDFTNATASVRVLQATTGTSDTYLGIVRDGQTFELIVAEEGMLYFIQATNGAFDATSIPYDPAAHRFWRIRHVASPAAIHFETSPDRTAWTTRRSVNPSFAVTAVRAELGAGTFAATASPGMAVFEDFSITRPGTTINQAPIARPGGPYSALVGASIAMNGSTSSDPDGSVASFSWNFGDGSTSTLATPSKSYATAGTFTVTLTVTDNAGATHSATTTATISSPANQPPFARAGGPYSATAGTAISLNGTTSSDPDGTIVSYAWNFGDGTNGSGATPSKTYAAAGSYTATLTVTDNSGATASSTASVIISAPANQSPISRPGGPYSGLRGAAIALNGSASSDPDGTIASYAWNFGDGSTATGATPSKTYATAGTFTITLIVTDNAGATNSATTTATISIPGNQTPVSRPGGPYIANTGQSITLNGTASTDADGTIASYEWRMGDTTRLTNTLTDDFNDNVRDTAKWSIGAMFGTIFGGPGSYDPAIAVAEAAQRVSVTLRANLGGDRYAGYVSAATVDFTGSIASVEVVQATAGGSDTLLCVGPTANNCALIVAEGGVLYGIQVRNGSFSLGSVGYNSTQQRHWRIRHNSANNSLIFETSSNGTAWTPFHTETALIPLTAARLEIGAGTYQDESAPGTAIFDNFRFARPTTVAETVLTGGSPSFSYTLPGTYTVRLKVTDNLGATHEATTTATVGGTPNSQPASTGITARAFAGPSAELSEQPGTAVIFPRSIAGKWNALTAATRPSEAAIVSATVRTNGTLTGVVAFRTERVPFVARIATDGTAAARIVRGTSILRVQLRFSEDGTLAGALHKNGAPIEFAGERAAGSLLSEWVVTPEVGLYTSEVTGRAALSLAKDAKLRVAGRLPGVGIFNATGVVGSTGNAAIFTTVPKGGVVIGWFNISESGTTGTLRVLQSGREIEVEAY